MADLPAQFVEALRDRYRLEREIGRGRMATVWLARDLRHDRPVALKLLRSHLAETLGTERFEREIRLAAQLQHPHILPVYDSGVDAGVLWFTMPQVGGGSLRDRLRREGTLPVDQAVRVAREVAQALQYAHERDVVHRDIKPENVLLSEDGTALVADFGIARLLGGDDAQLTATGLVLGTPTYMSPEQAAGDRRLDARTDVYSLGCLLYEALTGEPPFIGATPQAILVKRLSDPVPGARRLRAAVPEPLDRAVTRALARDPADRFPTMADFGSQLRVAEADATVPVGTPGKQAGRRRAARRVTIGVVALGVALLGVLGLAFLRARSRLAHAGSGPERLAVLYFDNLSPDTADAYLADGLTEEIIDRLGRVPRLLVQSRSAVRRFRGSAAGDLADVGRRLGVTTLLDGSVRRSGDRLRVTVELVQPATGTRLWGEEYDRRGTDLLSIEADIAQAVVAALAGRLDAGERLALATRPTDNPAAYDHFLRGNFLLARRTGPAVSQAMREYAVATSLDPGFAAPRVRSALCDALFAWWGWPYPGLTRDELVARGLQLTDSALSRDSTVSDAWLARATLLALREPRVLTGAEAALDRAVALDPKSSEAYQQRGWILAITGRETEAVAMYQRSLAIDPYQATVLAQLADVALFSRRLSEARVWFDSAISVDPGAFWIHAMRGQLRSALGDRTGAEADAASTIELSPPDYGYWGRALQAVVAGAAGDTTRARTAADSLANSLSSGAAPSDIEARWIASALLSAGEQDRAITQLERAEPKGARFWFFLQYPYFDGFRTDPRFQKMVRDARPVPARGGV